MDAYEATKIVFTRIQSLDAENAAKIMGLLLLQDHGEKEMIRLAFGPEALIQSVVLKARKELGLSSQPPMSSSSPASPSGGAITASPFLLNRQNSTGGRIMPPSPLAVSSPSSWAQSPVFSRSNSVVGNGAGALDELQTTENLISSGNAENSQFYNGGDYLDELQLQEQLSFLNDQSVGSKTIGGAAGDLFYPEIECRSPSSGEGMVFPYGWAMNGHHRRSCSANGTGDLASIGGDAGAGFGWKPCMYFARGYCKNGTACRFLHGLLDESATVLSGSKMDAAVEQQCQEILMRSKSQRIGSAAAASQLMASAFPYSPTSPSASTKCLSFLLQQQQQHNESQRAAAAAAAAALMLGGDESHKFMARARLDRSDLNPGSRQIYLTFPADSTFREEDVSNYFSIYGPVQDVRIPYQQKRMFGFVTFVYPETVKLILAKGNPHFVCDARVLVKPYKEKGKVPDKFRRQQGDRGDFSLCTTPTGLGLDSRTDPFDLQELGARMLYGTGSAQELLLRRKLEEQHQAAELQKAIELQSRRFMGLQLMDFKNRNLLSSSAPSFINTTFATTPTMSSSDEGSNGSSINSNELPSPEEKSPTGVASASADQKLTSCHGFFSQNAVNTADNQESNNVEDINKNANEFQQSDEHNLPDSPFASPTKSSIVATPFSAAEVVNIATSNPNPITTTTSSHIMNNSGSNNNNLISPPTLLSTSNTLDMSPYKSCFIQMPRFSSNHGAIGM